MKKNKKNKIKEPSVRDMQEFGAKFSKHNWTALCLFPDFVEAVSTDLVLAERLAKKYLK